MTFAQAKQIISEHLKRETLGEEEVLLLEGYSRVLREKVVSALDIPPFHRSTVDGYAVKAHDTVGAEEHQPVKLKLCGVVMVGESPKISVGKGEAADLQSRAVLRGSRAARAGGRLPAAVRSRDPRRGAQRGVRGLGALRAGPVGGARSPPAVAALPAALRTRVPLHAAPAGRHDGARGPGDSAVARLPRRPARAVRRPRRMAAAGGAGQRANGRSGPGGQRPLGSDASAVGPPADAS